MFCKIWHTGPNGESVLPAKLQRISAGGASRDHPPEAAYRLVNVASGEVDLYLLHGDVCAQCRKLLRTGRAAVMEEGDETTRSA
jgi:hypothetical protein